ncbi:MAG: FCD domain-containing protein [Pseudomonadaceae bacterium]|nr:FCD domain-containing protein [Pseudomonadaceae bacterium]
MSKPTSQRAATRVARNIVDDIKERALPPGTRLESEQVMVESQGVARATVREALRLLEFQGALRIKAGPGGGPVVNVPGVDHLTSALSLQLQFANASFQAVLEARRAIYPVLVAEAAQNANHQDIARLRHALKQVRNAIQNSGSAIAEYRHFYEQIAAAAQNLVLGLLVNALHRMSESADVKYDQAHWQASVIESERLLDAIEQGDVDAARTISTQSVNAAMRYQKKTAPEQLRAPLAWVAAD